MCVCVYACIHMYAHTHVTRTGTHTHTRIHVHMHTCTHTVHTYAYTAYTRHMEPHLFSTARPSLLAGCQSNAVAHYTASPALLPSRCMLIAIRCRSLRHNNAYVARCTAVAARHGFLQSLRWIKPSPTEAPRRLKKRCLNNFLALIRAKCQNMFWATV